MIRKLIFAGIILISGVFISVRINAQTSPDNIIHQMHLEDQISAPVKLALDSQDNIFIADIDKSKVVKYNAAGVFVEEIDVNGIPISLDVCPEGDLYIGLESGMIYKYNGVELSPFFNNGIQPVSMDFSPEGLLYVADGQNKEVVVINKAGQIIQHIGTGTIVQPTTVVYDNENARILISEHGGIGSNVHKCGTGMLGSWGPVMKIYVYDLNGTYLTYYGCHGYGDGKFDRIKGMAIGKCGNIYVCDPFQGQITVFDASGNFLTKFGQWGDSISQLNVPLDVKFDSQERIIVPSVNNGSLEIFTITDTLPSSKIVNNDAILCAGDFKDVEIHFTGTAPWSFKYTIDGVDTIEVLDNYDNPYIFQANQTGLYEVIELNDAFYSGNCFTGSAYVKITQNIPSSVLTQTDVTGCSGSEAIIPVELTGSAPWTITYTKDGANPKTVVTYDTLFDLGVTTTGLYEITALTGEGCVGSSFTGSTNVSFFPVPEASILEDYKTEICEGDTADFTINLSGTAPWSFVVSRDELVYDTISNVADNQYIFKAVNQGTYEIALVSDLNCVNNHWQSSYPELVVHSTPSATIASITDTICEGEYVPMPIYFDGEGPWTFSFSVDTSIVTTYFNNTMNPIVLSAIYNGHYEMLSVANANCNGPVYGASDITVFEAPSSYIAQGDTGICQGEVLTIPVNLYGTGPWTVEYTSDGAGTIQTIETSDTLFDILASEAGFYHVFSLHNPNCQAIYTDGGVNLSVSQLPVAEFTFSDDSVEVAFANSSSNATTYYWEFGDGTNSTEENPIHAYGESGTYFVSLTASSDQCGDSVVTDTLSVFLVSFDETLDPSMFHVYPNPTGGKIIFEIDGLTEENTLVEIETLSGQKILSTSFGKSSKRKVLDLSSFSEGIYIARVFDGQRATSVKIVLVR